MSQTNYMELIGKFYPAVNCSSPDPLDYLQIVWESGDDLPTQEALDAQWITYQITVYQALITSYRDVWLAKQGFYYQGNLYDCDPTAKTNVTGAITAVLVGQSLPSNFTWRAKTNQDIPMNAQQLTGLGVSMGAYVTTIFQWSWTLKNQVGGFTTADQFDTFDYTANWPSNNFDGTGPDGTTTNASIASMSAAMNSSSSQTAASSDTATS